MSLRNLSADVDFSTDSEDDDYVPSAEDSDDHVVHSDEEGDNLEEESKPMKNKKKRKARKEQISRKRKGGIKLEDENESEEDSNLGENETENSVENKLDNTEEDKAKVDALWADFLKDTNSNLKPTKHNSNINTSSSESTVTRAATNHNEAKPEKVTVTKVYQFAGEEVRVQEQVTVTQNSAKTVAAVTTKTDVKNNVMPKTDVNNKHCSSSNFPVKKPGGIGSIVNKISGKTPKLSTLEKSRLDWNNFKTDEGIEEELTIHNKGKDGYLEKQAFLQRSDLREFELERSLRQNNRSKR